MERVYDQKTELKIQQEFSRLTDECYLDHAGATLYSETQIRAISEDLCKNIYGNPHSLSLSSKRCTDLVDQIRLRVLNHFNTNPDEYSVIFTSGATGAIKLLLENFDWNAQPEDDDEEFFDSYGTIPEQDCESSVYVYTQSNHTSVVGGRQLSTTKDVEFISLGFEEAFSILENDVRKERRHLSRNSLFAYPAQCNFSGRKFPMDWVRRVHQGALDCIGVRLGLATNSRWFCLLDAASFCSTNKLDLSVVHPDFVCISFYKMFGYPTGLGALLVRNSSAFVLQKSYFGGGTVQISLPGQDFHKFRPVLHERFEDGTISFLAIISLGHGFGTLTRLGLNMDLISQHTFSLARYAVHRLKSLQHWNGAVVVELYADTDYSDVEEQGGIVNFNLKRSEGSYVGFIEVLHIANLHKIQFRTGCFCNSGACQRHLRLTDSDLKLHYQAGHICGDEMDLINGRPTGSIRISFGYMSKSSDVDKLLDVISDAFVESSAPCWVLPREKFQFSQGVSTIHLKKIFTYPVKSCGAMEVQAWKLNERGLEYDREWVIVNENGICLTQKDEPKLCLIAPKLDLKKRKLTLSFKTGNDLTSVPLDQDTDKWIFCYSKVCGDRIQMSDCGDEVSDWLSRNLGRDGLRLMRQSQEVERKAKSRSSRSPVNSSSLSLTNQAQYLLINDRSVKWLQSRIDPQEDFNPDTLVDRFRGNFIIEGAEEFSETKWERLIIGSMTFQVDGPCTRCQMICIDQHTGEKNRKPLVALSRALNGKLRFGIYLSHVSREEGALVQVGDNIFVDCKTIQDKNKLSFFF